MLPRLHGAFALAILFRQHPELLIGARLGSPLVVGHGDGETYLGSDALALAPLTQRIAYLEEGDWVVIDRDGAKIFDRDDKPVERPITLSGVSGAMIEFTLVDGRVRFAIDDAAATASGVQISSKLLELAVKVICAAWRTKSRCRSRNSTCRRSAA